MPKTLKENLTNWLVAALGFAGALWINKVIDNQSKIIDKLDVLNVAMATANSERGTLKEQVIELKAMDEKQNERLNKIQGISANQKLFKHEDFITLNNN